ncbi:helix-turn-helix transcriptional regulator [Mongoliitalea lutea]|uniref:WYL domain-containing protein n=1 Tax=Mongoliitalea lutea TaxID=849756 RepID=A0A8J3G742_9BACT|nr:WYL domain-containing protein [Mongoliitalea lutea]GHB49141.1 hypothetical protein GCM10008106_32420 [Mongoliitalea lutea]
MHTRYAYIRYMTIDAELKKDGVFMDDLILACRKAIAFETGSLLEDVSLSKRTLQDDLKEFRESFNAEIIEEKRLKIGIDKNDRNRGNLQTKKSKLKTYRYKNPEFTIANQPVSKKERASMIEAMGVLHRLSHMNSLSWLKDIVQGLELIKKDGVPNDEIISFEENPQLKGIGYLGQLYDFISKKQALEIRYFSHNLNQEFLFVVSPYFLKQYNKRWFLFARSHQNTLENPDRLLNLPLDRIQEIKPSDESYVVNHGVRPSEYLKDIIGVSFDESSGIEAIQISVDSKQYHYIESKPLHSSQQIISRNEDEVIIQINVYPNFELESLLLSKGEYIKVISPDSLKFRMSDRIEKMKKKY